MDTNLKRTPLYNAHVRLGGKIVPFAGWELPVQYSGVIPEHQAVRKKAGLFDVSHMGEIVVRGPQAEAALNYLTCNAVQTLYDGKGQYSAILNPTGGVVDDIIVYRYSPEHYLICVNASNTEKDFQWLTKNNQFNARIENKSSEYGQLALQGPNAIAILERVLGGEVSEIKPFHFAELRRAGGTVIVARTGYTGEDGFELFVPWSSTEGFWVMVLDAGRDLGLVPCGLGARDSLRLEACYPLHGHELGDDILALESGLGWIVKFEKGEFIGKKALLEQKQQGLARNLIGFFIDEPGIARNGDTMFAVNADGTPGQPIGLVTSGTKTPTLNRALGMGLVDGQYSEIGTSLMLEVRGKKLLAHVVKKPFYKRSVIV